MGDFNQFMDEREKRGGQDVCMSQVRQLQSMIDACSLIDLGFEGPLFTWSNIRQGQTNIQGRLDCSYFNRRWASLFPDARVTHLPRKKSNHLPLWLHAPQPAQTGIQKPFCVLVAWYLHASFQMLVYDVWDSKQGQVLNCFSEFQSKVTLWNRYEFGNIFDLKFRCLARLGGIQKALSIRFLDYLYPLEQRVRKELNETLLQEEVMWRQKSRIQWL